MPRLPRVTSRELVRVIEKCGFVLSRSRGSHQIFHHPETGKRVTVPVHSNKTIPTGTLVNILRESGLTRDELEDLLKR